MVAAQLDTLDAMRSPLFGEAKRSNIVSYFERPRMNPRDLMNQG
jgi:hypothetical protein